MSQSVDIYESAIAKAVEAAGGPIKAAKACGLSRQSIDKWIQRQQLPRTEYTGETSYAEALAAAADNSFSADWLRNQASPKKQDA